MMRPQHDIDISRSHRVTRLPIAVFNDRVSTTPGGPEIFQREAIVDLSG
jgi:hypothetical protein